MAPTLRSEEEEVCAAAGRAVVKEVTGAAEN
jgi:hypothetical protein